MTTGRVRGISVIIPAFNGAEWIAGAIRSVLSQEWEFELELIVVDDCSTDATLSVVRGIGDSRIRCSSMQRNSGVAAARNVGLSLASHDWIAFNDQDDIWVPGRLVKQVRILDAHLDLEAVAGGVGRLAADGKSQWYGSVLWWKWVPQHVHPLTNPPYYDPRLDGTPYLQTLLVSRRVAMQVGGFNEQLPLSDDLDFAMKIANIARFGYLQEVVFLYRLGQHNQTAPNIAKAGRFLGAQAYYLAAMEARARGAAEPPTQQFLEAYRPSKEELAAFELAQDVRNINTVWVNAGLLGALQAGVGTLRRHPGTFGRHFASRMAWWLGGRDNR
jgi:glycosyltransferase involved in cell wall biosynthesis